MDDTVSALLAEVSYCPGHEARRLLLAAVQQEPSWLIGNPSVSSRAADMFRKMVARREHGEPLQYIEGTVQFGPLVLRSDSRALIPRPETERLWELSVELIRGSTSPVIIDVCTGSGNLALALKHTFATARVIGVDLSPQALLLAQENATITGLDIEFLAGDLFAALPPELHRKAALVISNPPYVAAAELEDLPADVRDHEPTDALVSGPAGTEILARIANEAADWLRPGGVVACEIGETQGDLCLDLFAQYGPRVEEDMAGRPRYILGRAPLRPNVH
jgi:release factor glutamine methyltransferase